MARCPGIVSLIKCYLRLIFHTITFFCCVMLWPFAVLLIKYYNDGKYYLAKGPKRVTREKKLETSEVIFSKNSIKIYNSTFAITFQHSK